MNMRIDSSSNLDPQHFDPSDGADTASKVAGNAPDKSIDVPLAHIANDAYNVNGAPTQVGKWTRLVPQGDHLVDSQGKRVDIDPGAAGRRLGLDPDLANGIAGGVEDLGGGLRDGLDRIGSGAETLADGTGDLLAEGAHPVADTSSSLDPRNWG